MFVCMTLTENEQKNKCSIWCKKYTNPNQLPLRCDRLQSFANMLKWCIFYAAHAVNDISFVWLSTKLLVFDEVIFARVIFWCTFMWYVSMLIYYVVAVIIWWWYRKLIALFFFISALFVFYILIFQNIYHQLIIQNKKNLSI